MNNKAARAPKQFGECHSVHSVLCAGHMQSCGAAAQRSSQAAEDRAQAVALAQAVPWTAFWNADSTAAGIWGGGGASTGGGDGTSGVTAGTGAGVLPGAGVGAAWEIEQWMRGCAKT